VQAQGKSEPTAFRFRGFAAETQTFLASLEPEPCPVDWPAGERIAYATHVLSPLKALAGDLAQMLAHVTPPLGLEPRIGRSLSWPDDMPPISEECPVRQLRAWDAASTPADSPTLFVTLWSQHIEVGITGGGAEPRASARLRHHLLDSPAGNLRSMAAKLLAHGWEIGGTALDFPAGVVPGDVQAWMRERIRVTRTLSWGDWVDEPAFAAEIAAEFSSLLPLFDAMRGVGVLAKDTARTSSEPS